MPELDQTDVLDFGFEIMKRYAWPIMYLFLAQDDWQGGYEIVLQRLDPGHVEVGIRKYEHLMLATNSSLN